MNKFNLIIFIIVFLFKTGNVFSSTSDFNVNNIIVSGNINSNITKEKLLNDAFQKGFDKFINKFLLEEDVVTLNSTKLSQIKNLIFSYQIINNPETNEELNENELMVNLSFDRKKVYNFFISRNISYADLTETSLTIFPVLLENDNLYLYSDNPYYVNWNDDNESFIKFSLPLENIEDLEYINKNKNNLELIDINKLYSIDENMNYVFVIINNSNKALLKSSIYGKKIIKNINLEIDSINKNELYYLSIKKIKKEITQIWKSQNLIDAGSPSFLNILLEIKKSNDFQKIKLALNKIDLIERFSVVELNKNYAKIKIKYIGKIDKIKIKLKEQNINIETNNDEWKLSLK
jgi:hypothetical protein